MKTLSDKNDIIEAIKIEGDYKEFTYKTIKCEIKRVSGLNHLCGYLHLHNATEEQRKIIDDNFHLGITYKKTVFMVLTVLIFVMSYLVNIN